MDYAGHILVLEPQFGGCESPDVGWHQIGYALSNVNRGDICYDYNIVHLLLSDDLKPYYNLYKCIDITGSDN